MHQDIPESNSDYTRILDKTIDLYNSTPKNLSIKKIINLYENSPFYKIPYDVIKITAQDDVEIETIISYGKYLIRLKKYKEAHEIFSIALRNNTTNISAWYYSIISLQRMGAHTAAEKKINEALKKTKRHPAIINIKRPYASNKAFANKCLTTDSLEVLTSLTRVKPDDITLDELAYYHYALAFKARIEKNNNNAINNILLAIEIIPTEFRFWTLLTQALLQLDEPDNAFQAALEACTLKTTPFTLDYLLISSNKINKFYCFDKLIDNSMAQKINNPELINLKAKRFHLSGDYEAAFKLLSHSLEIDPKNPKTLTSLGLLNFERKKFQSAFRNFTSLFSHHPTYKKDVQKRLYSILCACFLNEWDYIDAELDDTLTNIEKLYSLDTITAAFFIMSLSDDFKKHSHIAKLTSKSILPIKNIHLTEKFKTYPDHKKVRVGYLSGDIGEHIVSHLFLPRLKRLNRVKFEPYVFSYRPNDGSSYYKEISENSNFHDISKLSDRDAAVLITNQEIDILVDLTVYTSASRSNIMSYRPAPIQLHHTGFPSTSGAPDSYDYMLVNKFLISEKILPYFSESLVIVPHISSFHRVGFSKKICKEQYNIPPNRFVLASFNEPHKITRHMFQLWCTVLKQNPDSVLWIYTPDKYRRDNILKEGIRNDVSHDRFVFADKVSFEEHRQRLHLADLLLDSFPYGNHSSAKMALESGTPIVSYCGSSLASRVSSMHLASANLNALIANCDASFIDISNRYIQDKGFRNSCLDTLEKALSADNAPAKADSGDYYELALDMLYSRFKENPSTANKNSFELPLLD